MGDRKFSAIVQWATLLAGLFSAGCGNRESPRNDAPKPAVTTAPGSPRANVDSGHHPPSSGGGTQGPPSPLQSPGTVPEVRPQRDGSFFGEPDLPRRRALLNQEIAEIERGSGGRSIAFKIKLADGTKGYFKPEQTFSAAHWYGEVAAYHLDRALGLNRAIPTVGRAFPWETLKPYAEGDSRMEEIIVQPDGMVRGAFVWWVSAGLSPLRLAPGWEKWVRFGPGFDPRTTPFQRPRNFAEAVNGANRPATEEPGSQASTTSVTGSPGASPSGESPSVNAPSSQNASATEEANGVSERSTRRAGQPDRPDRPAELSDMLLFDFLIHNMDRWSENSTNVRTLGRGGGPLVFLDNAAGFSPIARSGGLMESRLRAVQKFRRSTVAAIRAFDLRDYRRRLSTESLAPILTEQQLENLEFRRQILLSHVADMERRHGDAIYFDESTTPDEEISGWSQAPAE